jgi:hypothetical protein
MLTAPDVAALILMAMDLEDMMKHESAASATGAVAPAFAVQGEG